MRTASKIRTAGSAWLKRQFIPSVILLTVFVLWGVWFFEAGNYSDSNLPGIYVAKDPSGTDQLTIHPDHTYDQVAVDNGGQHRAGGRWRLTGNSDAHIVFEGAFLKAPAAAIGRDDRYAFGQFDNLFGYLTLTLQSDSTPLIFHKKHLFF